MTSASTREVLSTQRGGSLLDLEARLAKPCLFPFDGEPYRLTECQQAPSSNAESEAIVFSEIGFSCLGICKPSSGLCHHTQRQSLNVEAICICHNVRSTFSDAIGLRRENCIVVRCSPERSIGPFSRSILPCKLFFCRGLLPGIG